MGFAAGVRRPRHPGLQPLGPCWQASAGRARRSRSWSARSPPRRSPPTRSTTPCARRSRRHSARCSRTRGSRRGRSRARRTRSSNALRVASSRRRSRAPRPHAGTTAPSVLVAEGIRAARRCACVACAGRPIYVRDRSRAEQRRRRFRWRRDAGDAERQYRADGDPDGTSKASRPAR